MFGGKVSVACCQNQQGVMIGPVVTIEYGGKKNEAKAGPSLAASCGIFGPDGEYEIEDDFEIVAVYGVTKLIVHAPPKGAWQDPHTVSVFALEASSVIADGSVEVGLGTSGTVFLKNGATAYTTSGAMDAPLVHVGKGCCIHAWKSHGGAYVLKEEGAVCVGDGAFLPLTVSIGEHETIGGFSMSGAKKYLYNLGYYPHFGIWRMKGDPQNTASID